MTEPSALRPRVPEIALPGGGAFRLPGLARAQRPAWWKFLGPAFIISIGYFDPGNWATNLKAGSQFGYALLCVLSLSCLIGAIVQNLCAKLGIASGKDLAEHCAERYPPWLGRILFVSAAISMMATDLAEIIGVAIALELLFGIPLWQGAVITIVEVFLILLLNRWGFRAIEIVFLAFLAAVAAMYVIELVMSRPDYAAIALASVYPSADMLQADALFVAVGIIGATIMPHNLYLHSHLAKARLREQLAPPRTLYRWSTWDTNLSLLVAWFINVAILVVAAAVFHPIFLAEGTVIESFADAYKTLVPILGKSAGLIFALALLVSGIASSTSATLAGQVVFEGFLRLGHVNPFRIRLCTRLVTMAPALLAILLHVQSVDILIWSQVVLSLQLPFAMLPLVILTDDRKIMGSLVNARWVRLILWPAALLVLFLNNGRGVPRDHATAKSWYLKAADQGDADAEYNLGVMYDFGQGVPVDFAAAMSWYRKAAEQGHAGAQSNIGVLYERGQGVPEDYGTAVSWYRKAAEQGHAKGQHNLGFMYNNGRGVPRDDAVAAAWYLKAADQGDSLAQVKLGILYGTGQGVRQDPAMAASWFRRAADQGEAAAQYNLGILYGNGRGVPLDYVQAYKWFDLASLRYGSSDPESRDSAVKFRDMVAARMTPAQIAEAQKLARDWKPGLDGGGRQ